MSKKNSSRSGLFLLELIISILFFSMASAVCIRLFVQAHIMDRDNHSLTQSVKLCENLAEVYTACNGDLDMLTDVFPYFRRDPRSDVYVAPWRDMICYPLETATVFRFLRLLPPPGAPEGDAGTNTDSAPADTGTDNADDDPANTGTDNADGDPADTGTDNADDDPANTGTDNAGSDPADRDGSTGPDDSPLRGYAVQDMLMFLDRDFQPSIIPQSGGYVLCLISFELPQTSGTQSTGTLKNVSFGVWEYDSMRTIPVSESAAITGIVDDDFFERLSCLPEEEAVYLLDVTIYVPVQGGDGE